MATKATIEPNARVVLDYTLRDSDDDVLDASNSEDSEPIVYVHGYGMLVPGLEKALAGLAAGDEREVVVSPDEGFGERDEDLVFEVDRSEMPRPDAVAVGDEFVAQAPDGEEAVMRVIEVRSDAVVLDGNHPLAGETLRYSVVVRDVRPATHEEIEEAATIFEQAEEEFETSAVNGAAEPALTQLGRSSKSANRLPN
ncbi:MAG TPA: peptidylprolyl isomerase [Labilithrix sp.]|jgi:FKBP-type peptidyl-prolyl cis-trans isomerase SlyD|nr:peptidylprolyl isomerase [Labilithrix sp.]